MKIPLVLARQLEEQLQALERAALLARQGGLYGAERTLLHVMSHIKALLEALRHSEARF